MTTRILTYCECTPASAPEIIKLYEAKYNCKYSWIESCQNITDAVLVAIKEVNGRRYVITHSNYKFFLDYFIKTTRILGEL